MEDYKSKDKEKTPIFSSATSALAFVAFMGLILGGFIGWFLKTWTL